MSAFRLLVTGHRYCDRAQARFVRDTLERVWKGAGYPQPLIVVDGACPYGGVDRVAHLWADDPTQDGVSSERHPMRRRGNGVESMTGPQRNQLMVDLGADLCIGFPGKGSRGTWDCLAKATDAGIPILVRPLFLATTTIDWQTPKLEDS